MIYIYYFFAVIQIFFAYRSIRGGIDYLNFFKKELAKPKSNFTPFASIIVPCRGLDKDLRKNLEAVFQQDYPNYEIIFVVDDETDLAVSVIEELLRRANSKTKLVIAGKAMESGQKVHNLRQAVLEVAEESEVFVFMDSDARPNENWLRNIIAPLEDKNIGCATGYRWFVQKNGGFATHFRSVWNASIASALGENTKDNFCWGGSMAIRRETFEKLNIRKSWKGTLSDDFTLTNALKKKELPIYFVPQCLTATVEDCSFSELLEFTTRQMKITRIYSPNHWKLSFFGSTLFTFTFWAGTILLFFLSGIHFWLVFLVTLSTITFGVGKAWLRLKAVKLVLINYHSQLSRQIFFQITLWLISPTLYLYNCICALFSRKIIWRGIEYELQSADKTKILD